MLFLLVYFSPAAVAYKQISCKVPQDNIIYNFGTYTAFVLMYANGHIQNSIREIQITYKYPNVLYVHIYTNVNVHVG
jgi:hypothetical protein